MYFVLLIHLLQVLHVYSQDIVRLQRTYPKREGPIEIFYQGTWHTICGECWADNAANVACRELGFGGGVKNLYSTRQNITAIQYACSTGQESRLTSCQLIESCYQCRQAAGVLCSGAVKIVELYPPSLRQVVSVFGSYKGSYIWGHVCGECWTENNARATCKGLGYRSGFGSLIKQETVPGDDNNWHTQYHCKESDADLGSCQIIKTSCSLCENYAAVECHNDAKVSVDGVWGSWSSFGPCSVTCGGGYRNRNRTCNNPAPANGGRECTGNPQQNMLCDEINCPIDGGWSRWSDFGPCSVTCGQGHQIRTRTCDNPSPQHGGRDCDGDSRDVTTCTNGCLIDGGWSRWSDFGPCSVTCGQGYQIRTRTCDNPSPQHGGRDCDGDDRGVRLCHENECPNFSAIFSQEQMDFDTATEFCKTNLTGFLATPEYITNMFITCMDTDHVIWLTETRTTNKTNREDSMCMTGRIDKASHMWVTEVSCRELRQFICVVNRIHLTPTSDEGLCYGFTKTDRTTDGGGVSFGTVIGIVAACVILLLVAAIIFFIKRKRLSQREVRNKKARPGTLQLDYTNQSQQATLEGVADSNSHGNNVTGSNVDTHHYDQCSTDSYVDVHHYDRCSTGPYVDTHRYDQCAAGSSEDTGRYEQCLKGPFRDSHHYEQGHVDTDNYEKCVTGQPGDAHPYEQYPANLSVDTDRYEKCVQFTDTHHYDQCQVGSSENKN